MIFYKFVWFIVIMLQCIFFTSNAQGYRSKLSKSMKDNVNLTTPYMVNKKGDTVTYKISRTYKKSNLINCTKCLNLHYKLEIEGEDHQIDLEPNNVMSSGSVQEGLRRVNRQKTQFVSKANIKRFSDTQCQYSGHVKHQPNSKVAVSTCKGLMGYILLNNNFYMIEPVEDHNSTEGGQLHMVYQHNFSPQSGLHQFALNTMPSHGRQRRKKPNTHRMPRQADPGFMKQMYLETLVVLDKTLIEFHKSLDLENYILTVINMAHTLFRDSSFGAPLELVLVRMIRLEREDDEMNIEMTKDATRTLEVFQAWSKLINPAFDSHPNHHDVAILITRVDICLKHNTSCGLLGLANLASICNPQEQAILVEDTGLSLGFTIAHEIGHALGMRHDSSDESGCNPLPYDDEYNVVMAKQVSIKTRGWSNCSREYLWAFIDAGMAHCLYDEPSDHQFSLLEVLPGAMYGVSFQCQTLIDHTAESCPDVGVDCNNMKCLVREYGCVETHRALAEGTPCGEGAWCYRGQCLTEGQRPAAIDGGWSEWGAWTECSRTCGGGLRKATRSCDSPRSQNGGFYCRGTRVQYDICNSQPCPLEAPSYRDVQCAEFDKWLFPEDNNTHTWKNFHSTDEKPCSLVCRNERNQIAVLKTIVSDGTPCYRLRHMCVAGRCKSVPCDNKLGSNAIEDACGVCRGDGTGCTLTRGQKVLTKQNKARHVYSVPSNTQFAVFEEMSPTTATFYLKRGKQNVVSGDQFGETKSGKTTIWLGIVRYKQEILRITGPITEPLHVWMRPIDDVTIKYTIAKPANGRVGHYSWQQIGWSECSAQCGAGTEHSTPKCVERTNGHVDDTYCNKLEKPEELTRLCEIRKCEARWQVGEWSGCDCSCSDDVIDERSVDCVRIVGESEGEDDIVDDKYCLAPKPIAQRSCKCPKRPAREGNKERIKKKWKDTMEKATAKIKNIRHKTNCKAQQTMHKVKENQCESKLIDADHLKNVENIKKTKGKLIQDYDNLEDLELTLETDESNSRKKIPDFPKPHTDDNRASLKGLDAVKIIQKLQENHHTTTVIP